MKRGVKAGSTSPVKTFQGHSCGNASSAQGYTTALEGEARDA